MFKRGYVYTSVVLSDAENVPTGKWGQDLNPRNGYRIPCWNNVRQSSCLDDLVKIGNPCPRRKAQRLK